MPTHSPRCGGQDPGSEHTESSLSSDTGPTNKANAREDLVLRSSTACKAQHCLCTACEATGHMTWTHSGHVDDFLDVLLRSKKSQLDSYLPYGDTESLVIFPVRRNAVPGENEPWDQVTGNERTAPRRRVNGTIISPQVRNHAVAPGTHATGPRTVYYWGPMNLPFDSNLANSPERPQSLPIDPLHSNMSFNPDFGVGFRSAESMWIPSLDSPWILSQQTSMTLPPSLQVGATQSTFNSIPHDFIPTFVDWVPLVSPGLPGPNMQSSATDNNAQDYHGGNDVVVADFGIDPGQATFDEDPSTFLPNQQDSLPNLEFHDDRQGAEFWEMTTSPPVINILNFSTTDTGPSFMSDISSDFVGQLTTVQASPSIQSQGKNGSVTSTMIPEGSSWADNSVGFESSDTGKYGL